MNLQKNLTEKIYDNSELQCMYEADAVLMQYEIPIKDILTQLMTIIPKAFRYKELVGLKIEIGNTGVVSSNFVNTHLKLVNPIAAEGKKYGSITLIYTKPIREEKGIFLSNEKFFLSNLSNKIGSHLYYRNLRDTIAKLQKQDIVKEKNEELHSWLKAQHLRDDEIEKMLKVKIEFNKGETMIKQGAIASYIILLTKGLSKNYLEANTERGFNFKIVRPFEFIGLSALYDENTYPFSGAALSRCEAYLIDSQLVKNIISSNEDFAKNVLNWYCSTTRNHLNRLSSIANKQSLQRLAEVILYLSDEIFRGPILTNNVSRKDIAELAAISTESGVRFLSDLKKDGIIAITPNKIEILKYKVLRLIAG